MPKKSSPRSTGREQSFDFLDAKIFIELPTPKGEQRLQTDLLGSFGTFTDREGNVEITHLDGRMGSLRLPVPVKRRTEMLDTGAIVVRNAAVRAPREFVEAWGRPNTGHLDDRTGIVRLTWGIEAVLTGLSRMGIGPVPILLHEVGVLDRKIGRMHSGGTGLVLSGPFRGIYCLCCNCSKPAAPAPPPPPPPVAIGISYAVSSPPTVCTPVTITVTSNPGTTVTLTWNGLAMGLGPTPTATFSPNPVTTGPGGTGTTSFHITSGKTGQRGDISATGSDGSTGLRTIPIP